MSAKYMEELWVLSGKVWELSKTDDRYAALYRKLSEALDTAEVAGLVKVDDEF